MERRLQIGVIGYAGREEYKNGRGGASKQNLMAAKEIGQLLAERKAVVVTGGKSGIMVAAAEGAKSRNGVTVGVVKGSSRFGSNQFTDIEVLSGMSADGFDELLLVLMCDALIVIGGGAGTLEEIAIAYRNRKRIVVLDSSGGWADKLKDHFIDERETVRVEIAKTAEEAVAIVLKS